MKRITNPTLGALFYGALITAPTPASLAGDAGGQAIFTEPETAPAPDCACSPCSCPRADALGPVGVMGSHVHSAGEWMLSFRTMFMRMDGIRSGTDDLSTAEVHALGFPVAPTDMDMWMHMVGVMFAPTDWATLMLMTNYQEKKMDHHTAAGSPPRAMRGETFVREESGWGDLSLSALVPVYRGEGSGAHLRLGLSAPTAESSPLPYPMQLGSGTWDLLAGATWSGFAGPVSYGAQVLGTVRLEDEGERGYAFPDQFDATAWLGYLLTDRLAASLRLSYVEQGEFEGRDPDIGAFMSPQMDAANLPTDRLDLSLGLNVLLNGGHRLGVEAGMPIWEDSDGPRLSTEWSLTAGWEWVF